MSKTQVARGRGHGHRPPREADIAPWQETAVDLNGPWTVKLHGFQEHGRCVTNCPELIRIKSKTSLHVAQHFENSWHSQCPRPMGCICDQGPEFAAHDFQAMLDDCNIQR
jgi:hypothetical protein